VAKFQGKIAPILPQKQAKNFSALKPASVQILPLLYTGQGCPVKAARSRLGTQKPPPVVIRRRLLFNDFKAFLNFFQTMTAFPAGIAIYSHIISTA
jgi:hypothetical protein